MDYVDGGVGVYFTQRLANYLQAMPKTKYWWGVAWDFSASSADDAGNKFSDLAFEIGINGSLLAGAARIITGGLGALYFGFLTGVTGYAFYKVYTQLRDANSGATLSLHSGGFRVNPW